MINKTIIYVLVFLSVLSGCSKKNNASKVSERKISEGAQSIQQKYGNYNKKLFALATEIGKKAQNIDQISDSLKDKYLADLKYSGNENPQSVVNVWRLSVLSRELNNIVRDVCFLAQDDIFLSALAENSYTDKRSFQFKMFLSTRVNAINQKLANFVTEMTDWIVGMENPSVVAEMRSVKDTLEKVEFTFAEMKSEYGLYNEAQVNGITKFLEEHK